MKKLLILLLSVFILASCTEAPEPAEVPEKPVSAESVMQEDVLPEPQEEKTEPQEDITDEKDLLLERAEEILSEMTLEEKVGQMFLVKCPENAVDEISKYGFGGIVLFAYDFRNSNPDSIKTLIAEYQGASKIPLIVAVDEEGGTVSRVGRFKAFRDTPFLSPRETFEKYGWQGIEEDAKDKAELLLGLGINLNLSPVCDLSDNENDFIYKRSFSGDPEDTARFVATAVETMKSGGLMTCLKHFPGYSSNADTHTSMSFDDRSLSSFINADFVPFMSGIQAGSPFVMVSHNIIVTMDDKPASLSLTLHKELERLGFDGAIMTDDLAMSGITEFTDGKNAAVLAVLAGNHVLCTSSYEDEYSAVLDAVKNGEITEETVNASVLKIFKIKLEYGVIQ